MLIPFSPPPGLNSDDTSFSAEGRWADGDNVRFRLGKPQTVGREMLVMALPVPVTCYDIFAFTRGGLNMIAYGQSGQLYIANGFLVPSDRTPSPPPPAFRGWSMAAWGDTLLAAPWGIDGAGGTLYAQSGSSAAAEVAQAPDRIDAGILVTPERQVLAFACTEEGGTHNPLCIRGCDIEDYTDWTSSSTNNAFEHILDGPGEIVARAQVGPYVVVLTTSALFLGQYIGEPGQAYRFDKVASIVSPMSRRSVAVFDEALYWIGSDLKLRTWSPGSPVSEIPCPISRDFENNFIASSLPRAKSFMVANRSHSEIWFFYQDIRDGSVEVASRYIAYSIGESLAAGRPVWFRGRMSRTAMLDSEIARAAFPEVSKSLVGANQDEHIFLHDLSGSSFLSSIRSAGLYLDDSRRRMMIRGIVPDFENQDFEVALQVHLRDRPQSASTTKGPFLLLPSTVKKDFRASGRIAEIELSGGGAEWRVGKLLLDVVPMGER